LVKTTTEAAGANCATGGVKLEYGLDANTNNVLDVSEINATLTKYVCNGNVGAAGPQGSAGLTGSAGATGATGAAGPQGPIGANGAAGANGANGNNTLVKTTTEAAGANCATGGVKLEYGLDVNNSGVLDISEINASLTKYVCNGENTAGSSFQGVRIGFSTSTTWVCPPNVTQIQVEVWGAGGGGATGSFGSNYYQCGVLPPFQGTYFGEAGGAGGNGGYNSATLAVTPGEAYQITIGQGGAGANGFSQGCPSYGNNGADGGNSSFSNLITANGGGGGSRGVSYNNANANSGIAGQNGIIQNYNHPTTNYGTRSFIPQSYLVAVPGASALGGAGGGYGWQNNSTSLYFPPNASNGENGYCVITH
jgi:hypothetical protein